jgi:hypothetical protein
VNDLTRFLRAEWDRLAGYACLLAGAVALVFGFAGVRNAADVVDEISYLVTGGIGAVFLLGVGATLLLSADLHDDFRKLHRVEEKLDHIYRVLAAEHPELVDARRPADPPAPAAPVEATGDTPRAAVPTPAAAVPGVLAVARFRRLAFGAILVAGVLFLAGSLGAANEPGTDDIARPVGLALTGAMLVAVMAGVMAGQLKGRLERQQLAALGPWLSVPAATAAPTAPAAEVWVVDGLTLYHRAGCRALDGRAARAQHPGALAPGVRPCGLCEPGPTG